MNDWRWLQLFAEGDPAGDAGTEQTGSDHEASETTGQAGAAQKSQGRTYTDADVDRIIEKKFAKWSADREKAVSEASKLAEMNAQQKAEYERDQLLKQIEELRTEKTRSELTGAARKILADEGIHVTDSLALKLIGADAEETKENVEEFARLFQSAVQEGVKAAYKGGTPKAGADAKKPTKDEILAIKDPILRQNAIAENIDLFQ